MTIEKLKEAIKTEMEAMKEAKKDVNSKYEYMSIESKIIAYEDVLRMINE